MPITDEYMMQMITKSKEYTVVIIKATQKRNEPEAEKVIWEHARRNFSLREEGKLPIACPINDETEVKGVGVFSTNEEETKRIMDEDPAVKAGIFTYETHPCRSFPGDMLP
jgi:uncharacterized protein YciI